MNFITKIKILNFKRFKCFEVSFDERMNLLIGDNEAGKSSILTAIDLVLSGSRNKVETIGLEYLMNSSVVEDYLNSSKKLENLPRLEIELYVSELNNEETNGKINRDNRLADGLKLICKPNDEYSKNIADILKSPNCIFPFEFYSIEFKTFSDNSYSGYNKYLKHILIDNSQVSSEYAMKEFIKDVYNSTLSNLVERYSHQHEYRLHKERFKNSVFDEINKRISIEHDYNFAIKSNSKSNLQADLTILEGEISIDNKGKGKQCIIKTELVLSRNDNDLEIVLLEEPENHLSHNNMKKLIKKISSADNKQIFIATHSTLISTRLDLRKSILLNSNTLKALQLKDLSDATAKFFIKAPDNNLLEFILSKNVILVEGHAEYILMESFLENLSNINKSLSQIHIISVNGTSFKRYLDIAMILKIKTAVIRDNDRNFKENCVDRFIDYGDPNIRVFADTNDQRYTFEVCIYQDNLEMCDLLFKDRIRKFKNRNDHVDVQEYMLNNKAEVAYTLLTEKQGEIKIPEYILDAIRWIRE